MEVTFTLSGGHRRARTIGAQLGHRTAKGLAFVSDRDGTPDIYTMQADGSGVRRLTESNGHGRWSRNPAWSPSGDAIAFDSNRTGIEEIYVLTIGSGQVQQLTHTAGKVAGDEGNWTAAWSPDGKKISFSSNRDAIPGKLKDPSQWGIYVMNADGSSLHRLTHWDDAHAIWSPDGKRILFESSRNGRKNDGLYVMNADGTSVQLITGSQSSNRHADWCRSDVSSEPAPCIILQEGACYQELQEVAATGSRQPACGPTAEAIEFSMNFQSPWSRGVKDSAFSVNGDGGAVDDFGLVSAQEQDDASNVLGLWPFREIRFRHGFAVRLRVNNAGKNRVHAHAAAL